MVNLEQKDFSGARGGVNAITSLSVKLRPHGILVLPTGNFFNSVKLAEYTRSGLLSSLGGWLPFSGPGIAMKLVPVRNQAYTAILFAGRPGADYYSSSYRIGATRANHETLGVISQVGPFVWTNRTAFGTVASEIPANTAKAMNKFLNAALAYKGNHTGLVSRLLGRKASARDSMKYLRTQAEKSTQYAKTRIQAGKIQLKTYEKNLKVNNNKMTLLKQFKRGNPEEGLEKALKEKVIKRWFVIGGSVVLVFPKRVMVLDEYVAAESRSRCRTNYPAGDYEFPEAFVVVGKSGSSCRILKMDGSIYPHPHAHINAGNPCWDEETHYNGDNCADPLLRFSNHNRADILWYTNTYEYCMLIFAYLTDFYGGRYSPFHFYGKRLKKITTVAKGTMTCP